MATLTYAPWLLTTPLTPTRGINLATLLCTRLLGEDTQKCTKKSWTWWRTRTQQEQIPVSHLSAYQPETATLLLPDSSWNKQRTTAPGIEWATTPRWSLPPKKATGKYASCSRKDPINLAVRKRGKTSGFFYLDSLGGKHFSLVPPTPHLENKEHPKNMVLWTLLKKLYIVYIESSWHMT